MQADRQDKLSIVAADHPLRVETRSLTVERGLTVEQIVEHVQPDPVLRRRAHVEIDGMPVDRSWWPYVRPRRPVYVRTVPADSGGDKNVMRTVMLIGVTIAGGAIAQGALTNTAMASWFSGGLAANTAGAVALGAATNLAGRALVNQIAPPAVPDQSDLGGGLQAGDRLYSLRGTRNRLRRYGSVPRVYGRHRQTPPYAAEPFTEVVGEHQYLRALFCWGYGPLDVTDIRIGDTPITDFEDVEVETVGDNTVDGHPDLFSRSVDETDLNVALTNSAGFQQRTTDDVADEISVDVLFPNGLFELTDQGDRLERTVTIKIEYAEQGTGNWQSGNVSLGARTLDLSPPGTRKSYAGLERTSAGLQPTYNVITYGKKVLVAVDAFDGTLRTVESSTVVVSADDTDVDTTSLSSVSKPAEPAHSYQIAVVELEGSSITQVTNLTQDGVTGFGVSKQDADTISVAAGTVTERLLVVTEKKAEALRRSVTIKTDDGTKQYDVRLRRETADSSSDDVFDDVRWTKLRAVQREQPVQMDHVALTALRIRATDQLNGTLDELNGVCQAILTEYDVQNDVWLNDVAARTPAAAFRNILEGRANGRPVSASRLDLESLEQWTEFTVPNAMTFDHVFTDTSVTEALDTVASTGRAAKTLVDGRWGVVVDEQKSTVVQHFTPRNSHDFQAEKTFGQPVHALRVAFINRNANYQRDEIVVYADGFTADGSPPAEQPPFPDENGGYSVATRFDGLDLVGVTDERQAFRAGRYHLAVDKLRPEVYTWRTDVEHLVATRGDLVRCTHDVPQWGTAYGRVKSVGTDSSGNVDEVVVDTDVDLTAGQDYVIRFRLSDGSTKLVDVDDPGADTTTDTLTPAAPISSGRPQAGDLFMLGLSGSESVELIIRSVEPEPDLGAKVTAVDHSPAVFDAHAEAVPNFDPRITETSAFVQNRPPIPRVDGLQSDEGVLIRSPDGGVSARLVATYTLPSDSKVNATHVQMRYRKTGSQSAFSVVEADAQTGRVAATDVDQGDAYRVELRSLNRNLGTTSSWVTASDAHVVAGASARPPDVTGFELEIIGQSVYLRWDAVNVFDLDHYEIRFAQTLTGASWVSSTILRDSVPGTANESAVPGQVGSYLIKAVDRGGRKSQNAAVVASNATEVLGLNVVEQRKDDPDFPGIRQNVHRTDDYLQLSPANNIDAWTDITQATVPRLDFYTGDITDEGIYFFDQIVDLGQVYTSRVSSAVEASGINMANFLSGWGPMSNLDPLSAQTGDEWDATVEVRTTDGDPNSSSPGWSAWQPLKVGDHTARAFDFRLVLTSLNNKVAPRVTRLEASVDMPDRVEGQDDVVVSDGQLTVQYSPAFKERPSLGYTAEDLNAGEYLLILNKARTGFDVEIRDSGGTLVTGDRRFTWVAKGFGREVTS